MDEKSLREEIIDTLGVRSDVISGSEIVGRVAFLKNYLLTTGARGYVLGISGGQDSTLAGRLAQLAVEEVRRERGEAAARFVAMRLPYGEQADEADAQQALAFIAPDDTVVFNIKPSVDAFKATFDGVTGELHDYHKGNVKARMRMVAQYAYAGEHGLLVIGTDHAAEAVTGFFTKFRDGAADILPLSGLSKRQGKELLQVLNAPAQLYEKSPTADLLDLVAGQADETELGITYEQLDDYLEGKVVDEEVAALIEARYLATQHKRLPPVAPTMTY